MSEITEEEFQAELKGAEPFITNNVDGPVERFHFFIFGGVVTYIVEGGQEYERKVNAYITSGFQGVNELQIHYAQQQSAQLIKKTAPEGMELQVVNVFVNNIDYLGYMTADEFRPPVKDLVNGETTTDPNTAE